MKINHEIRNGQMVPVSATIENEKEVEFLLDQLRPKGEWLIVGEEQGALGIIYKIRKCNRCGWESSLPIPRDFCPKCGMDARKKEISNV